MWRGLGALALVGMLALAGCGGGGTTDSAGVNLGTGPLLAFIGGDGNLWLARGDGTNAHAVTTTNCPPTINCYGPPTWSPDGTQVAVFGPDKTTPTITTSISTIVRASCKTPSRHRTRSPPERSCGRRIAKRSPSRANPAAHRARRAGACSTPSSS